MGNVALLWRGLVNLQQCQQYFANDSQRGESKLLGQKWSETFNFDPRRIHFKALENLTPFWHKKMLLD